jgi:predicted permease
VGTERNEKLETELNTVRKSTKFRLFLFNHCVLSIIVGMVFSLLVVNKNDGIKSVEIIIVSIVIALLCITIGTNIYFFSKYKEIWKNSPFSRIEKLLLISFIFGLVMMICIFTFIYQIA